MPDRRLELMLVCAHPAIAAGDRTPLMLNTVLGFTAEQVGRSYAVPTRTMATRLVRAKRRIRDNRIPFRVPDRSQLPGADGCRARRGLRRLRHRLVDRPRRARPAPRGAAPRRGAGRARPRRPGGARPGGARRAVVGAATGPGCRPTAPSSPWPPRTSRPGTERSSPGRTSTSARRTPPAWSAATSSRPPSRQCTAPAARPAARTGRPCSTCTARSPSWHRASEAQQRSRPSRQRSRGPEAGLALLDADAGRTSRLQPAWATRAELLARLGRDAEAVRRLRPRRGPHPRPGGAPTPREPAGRAASLTPR